MNIYKNVTELIGGTPLMELVNYERKNNVEATILAKLEYFNPAGSVKDRVAKSMIEDAEKRGILKKGSVIIEPTSGNTGIGLASIAASRGYRLILTMPETMSVERRNLLKAYGAELVLTDGSKGMKGAIEKADELAKEIPGSFIAGQFVNPANPDAHFETTSQHIRRGSRHRRNRDRNRKIPEVSELGRQDRRFRARGLTVPDKGRRRPAQTARHRRRIQT